MSVANLRTGLQALAPNLLDDLASELSNHSSYMGTAARAGVTNPNTGAGLLALLNNATEGARITEMIARHTDANVIHELNQVIAGTPMVAARTAILNAAPAVVAGADGLVNSTFNDTHSLSTWVETGNAGGSARASIGRQDIGTGVFSGEYEAARQEAMNTFRKGSGNGGNTSSAYDSITSIVDRRESFEGSEWMSKRELDAEVKANLKELKKEAKNLSASMGEALGGHKRAYAALQRDKKAAEETLKTAYESAVAAATDEVVKKGIRDRYGKARAALQGAFDRQAESHHNQVEALKDLVGTLKENGVELPKSFNFELTEKLIINKTESSLSHAGEGAVKAHGGDGAHTPAPKGGGWGTTAGVAAAAAGVAYVMSDDENKARNAGIACLVAGAADRARRAFFSGASTAMGAMDKAANLGLEGVMNAASHARI